MDSLTARLGALALSPLATLPRDMFSLLALYAPVETVRALRASKRLLSLLKDTLLDQCLLGNFLHGENAEAALVRGQGSPGIPRIISPALAFCFYKDGLVYIDALHIVHSVDGIIRARGTPTMLAAGPSTLYMAAPTSCCYYQPDAGVGSVLTGLAPINAILFTDQLLVATMGGLFRDWRCIYPLPAVYLAKFTPTWWFFADYKSVYLWVAGSIPALTYVAKGTIQDLFVDGDYLVIISSQESIQLFRPDDPDDVYYPEPFIPRHPLVKGRVEHNHSLLGRYLVCFPPTSSSS